MAKTGMRIHRCFTANYKSSSPNTAIEVDFCYTASFMGMSESPTWSQLKKHNMLAGEFNHFAVTCFRAHVHDRFTWSVFMLDSALLSKLYILTSSGRVWTASYVEVMLYARLKPCGGRAARQWLFSLLPTGGRCVVRLVRYTFKSIARLVTMFHGIGAWGAWLQSLIRIEMERITTTTALNYCLGSAGAKHASL